MAFSHHNKFLATYINKHKNQSESIPSNPSGSTATHNTTSVQDKGSNRKQPSQQSKDRFLQSRNELTTTACKSLQRSLTCVEGNVQGCRSRLPQVNDRFLPLQNELTAPTSKSLQRSVTCVEGTVQSHKELSPPPSNDCIPPSPNELSTATSRSLQRPLTSQLDKVSHQRSRDHPLAANTARISQSSQSSYGSRELRLIGDSSRSGSRQSYQISRSVSSLKERDMSKLGRKDPCQLAKHSSKPSTSLVQTDGHRSSTGMKPAITKQSSTLSSSKSTVVRPRHCGVIPHHQQKPSVYSLADELLLKIFDYLTPCDLLMCCRVNKRWMNVANDNVLWYHVYRRYFITDKTTQEVVHMDQCPPYYWKQKCLSRPNDFQPQRILRQLKVRHPFTGLPRDTQTTLEKLSVKWVLALVSGDGEERSVAFHSDLCYFSMSLCVRWYPPEFKTDGIKLLRIYAARPVFFDHNHQALPNSPCGRCLVVEMKFVLDELLASQQPIGTDKTLSLYSAENGVSYAVWKEGNSLAFVTVSLHYHQLVQRCIMGDHSRVFVPQVCKVPSDDVDTKYGLHGYSCTLELRNLRNSLWCQQFTNLFADPVAVTEGWFVFQLIHPEHSYERSSLNKKIVFPWKTTAFTGKILNTCMLDCTVLDEHNNPMWCTSLLTSVRKHENANILYDYDGQDLQFLHASEPKHGRIDAVLIWEETTSQFFIPSLQLRLHIEFINQWFGTKY